MTDLTRLEFSDAAAGLRAGDFSSTLLLESYLARIATHDNRLNCFITLLLDQARQQAKESDGRSERLLPLDGIPIALKDNIDLAQVPTTNGMPKLRTPDQVSEVSRRLRQAGAVLIGKVNMHEGPWVRPQTTRTMDPHIIHGVMAIHLAAPVAGPPPPSRPGFALVPRVQIPWVPCAYRRTIADWPASSPVTASFLPAALCHSVTG
ncbi:MAG: Mandelamide hydrolase [Alphaproteobacteria bacterium MarineAlpha1_Bin1]|nr:MAG: Mandelamide hydrolase [Alphaproteobacteria bacterium MarineAlpha1_Bin1]